MVYASKNFILVARYDVFLEFVPRFFLFVHGETHDNESRKREWRKKAEEAEEREKKGGGEEKKKYKENCRKKRRGGVWAITTWLELQRTPSLLGIPLDPVTKGNDPRFLASKPDHHVFLRVYSISLCDRVWPYTLCIMYNVESMPGLNSETEEQTRVAVPCRC